jgi:ferric-dicitrate binding protein FerR (iron transport regulator)
MTMRADVTRDVVSDLWPLCRSGDASADSRALVDAFLAQDAHFASVLKQSEDLRRVVPSVRLSPDAELRLLLEAQKQARLKLLIIGGCIALPALLGFGALVWILLLSARGGF